MKDKPYTGMGNVNKEEGLCLKKRNEGRRIIVSIPGGFVQVPIPFLRNDPEVIDNDILVYNALGAFVNNITKIAWHFLKTVSKVARRNEKLVTKTIQHLVKIGWITKIRRGLGKSNIYMLHLYKEQKFNKKELESYKKAANEGIGRFS